MESMRTMEQLQTLRRDKNTEQTISLAYYDSTRNPRYLTRRLQEFFNNAPHYKQNWMATIVDAVRNKLLVDGFTIGVSDDEKEDPRQAKFNAMWDTQQLNIEADLVHEYSHAIGEAFMIAGLDSSGKPVAYAADPRAVVAYYGSEDPRTITQGAYFWLDGETNMATHWYIMEGGAVWQEDYKGEKRTASTETPATASRLAYVRVNEAFKTDYPRIPIFHFRRSARNIKPEFYQVQDMQDMVNKLLVAQGFAIENAADKIRVVITSGDVSELAQLRAGDVGTIPPAPANTQPVSFGTFDETDFTKLSQVINDTVMAMASITSTPAHHFPAELNAGISGEALQAREAPLIAKIERYIRRYAPEWEGFAAFMLTIGGDETTTDEVTCNYKDPRTVLTISEANTMLAQVSAGIPIVTLLRNKGWRQDELDQMLADKDAMTPMQLDEQGLQDLQDRLATTAEGMIAPMLEQAITFIGDAALERVVSTGAIEKIAAAQNIGET
jgi:hypothetical protein